MTARAAAPPSLKRSLGLGLLTLYGLGVTIGAGIYVLVGAMAGMAGVHAPVAFLVAAAMVACTALSFAELAARFPHAAGEAVYAQQAFGRPALSLGVGLAAALAAIVSAATIVSGSTGYVRELVPLPGALTIPLVAAALTLVAIWGIVESTLLIGLITLLEIGGLVAVILAGAFGTPDFLARLPEIVPPFALDAWSPILSATLLAFFAFIGFEAMVNVAEEVKDVSRTMPRAIALTVALSMALYGALACVAVLAVPPEELAPSEAPLALVFERASGLSSRPLSAIAAIATFNGALVEIIMASRLVYGLAAQGALPRALGRVDARTRTPAIATAAVGALTLAAALALPLATLAEATSFILLIVFLLMNIALFVIKRRAPSPPGTLDLPRYVPLFGAALTASFLVQQAASFLLA